MLLNLCKAAIGQANINAQELQDIGIYLPPIDVQQAFVAFKKHLDKSKYAVLKLVEKLSLLVHPPQKRRILTTNCKFDLKNIYSEIYLT